MTTYKTIRTEERKAASYHLSVCLLAIMDDDALALLNLPSELRMQINDVRASEDDFAGCAAAGFALNISNFDLTDQDRLVVAQIMAVTSGAIAENKVVTKSLLDSEDVLTNVSVLQELGNWISSADAPRTLIGDAMLEQSKSILDYIEQYNSAVLDKSVSWTKGGGTNDDETADQPTGVDRLLDWIPGVGKN